MSPSTGAEVDRKIAAVLIAAVQAYLEDEDGGVQGSDGRVWKMALRGRSGWSRASSWPGRGHELR